MTFTGERRRIYTNKYRAKRRAAAIAYLGGHCIDCGTDVSLEFDHKDTSTKLARIAKLWTASKKTFWEEVAKCVLRCSKHHRERSIRDGHFGVVAE